MTKQPTEHLQNQAVFDRYAAHYLERALLPPEFELLKLYRDRWLQTDMLDLGVGAGRTALTFSALARNYVGLDYAPRMIELCKARIAESSSVQFVVGDATDLSPFAGRRFDLVLFSFNGIDYVGPEQRIGVLAEVRKLLKPDGYFFFSSHNLNKYPFKLNLPRKAGVSAIRWAGRCAKRLLWYVRQKRANRHIGPAEARTRGWAVLTDGEHHFDCQSVYVWPPYQAQQLIDAGFELLSVFDAAGKAIDWRVPSNDNWLSYLCRLESLTCALANRGLGCST